MFDLKQEQEDYEFPECIEDWGWRFHHVCIPTKERMPGEKYFPRLKFFVSSLRKSPYGIKWVRFEKDSPVAPLIQKVPHVAFEVEDVDLEISLHSLNVIAKEIFPERRVKATMIEHQGSPVELLEYLDVSPEKHIYNLYPQYDIVW